MSEEAINAIRNAFFKANVELFSGYGDFISTDPDGWTQFKVHWFIDARPQEYAKFYQRFFKYNQETQNWENQNFLEFLKLKDAANLSVEVSETKQFFDNAIQMNIANKTLQEPQPAAESKKDVKQAKGAEPCRAREILPVQTTRKTMAQVEQSYLCATSQQWLIGADDESFHGDGEEALDDQEGRDRRCPFYPLSMVARPSLQPQDFTGAAEEGGKDDTRALRYRYRIVPPFNACLMREFEQIGQRDLKEENRKKIAKKEQKYERPLIPSNCKNEKTYVFLCWIYMWCGTLFKQDNKEKLFRTN